MYKKVCIWGASTTEGFYDTEAGGWVDRLKQYLSFKDAVHIYNLGISGAITDDIIDRFDIEARHRRPDQILFSLGNNDSAFLIEEKRNKVSIKDFQENIRLLINKSKQYTDDITMVCSPPVDEDVCNPWQGKMLYLNKYLKEYNAKIIEVCKDEKIQYIELYDQFEKVGYKKLLYDGLHPNAQGHKLMFEIIKGRLGL